MIDIFVDGTPLYIPGSDRLVISSPRLTVERGKAGSFQFGLPPVNKHYGQLKKLKSIVSVVINGTEIFRGRVLSEEKDFYNIRTVYCEGDLAYLNDSVQKGEKFVGTTHELFRKIIAAHNARVDEDKRFEIGRIGIEDREIIIRGQSEETSDAESGTIDYRQIEINGITNEWKTTLDYIESCLIDYCGGYLQTRHEGETTYLDLLMPGDTTVDQTIEYGVNLIDLTEAVSPEDLFTVLVPLGDDNLTIESVNGGSDELVDDALVAQYGRIVKTHVFDSVNQPATLLENGRRFLASRANVPVTLTIRAIDMNLTDAEIPLIRVGALAPIVSRLHHLSTVLSCARIEYDLDSLDQTIFTFGSEKDSLTERYRKDKNKSGGGGGGAAAEAAVEEASDRIYKAWINVSPESGHIDLGTLYQELKNTKTVLSNSCGIDIDAPNNNINIKNLKEQCDEQGQTINSQAATIETINKDLETKINLVAARVDTATSQHAELSTQVNDHEARISSLTGKTAGLENDIAETKTSISQLSDETSASIDLLSATTTKQGDSIASLQLLTTEQGSSITLNADRIALKADRTYVDDLYAQCVKAASLEADVLKVFETARIEELKTKAFHCAGTASVQTLVATGGIIDGLAVGTSLQIGAVGVLRRAFKMGDLVSANMWGDSATAIDISHSHKVTVNNDGTITLGEVATSGGSFKIADTAYYKNGVSAAHTAGKNDYISNLVIWGLSGSGTVFSVCAGSGTNRYADKSQTGELSLIVASKLVKASVDGVQVGTISCQDVYDAGYQAAINDATVSVTQGNGAVTIVFGEMTKAAGAIWAQASAQASYADSTCTPWAYAYYTDTNGNSVLADRAEGRTYDFS